MPNPMAMESAPLMMMEAESRREKAMPQASSKMEEPVPVRIPEMICSVLPSKGDSAPDPSKRSVPVAPSSAAATRVGVDELGVEDACDKQQQAVDEDRDEIGQGQLIVEGPGLEASGSENAAFVEHGAVDPRLMQAVAERNET